MDLQVNHERRAAAEGPPAATALVGFLRGVDSLMLGEGEALPEGLRARLAPIRLLPGVGPPVPDECRAVAEGSPARVALVGLLAGVDAPVLGQVGPLAEGLAAVLARVGPLPGVHRPVLGRLAAATESFAALPARVGLLPRVDPPVLGEVGDPAEGPATLRTRVGLRSRVDHQVLGQVRFAAEGLAALAADERRLAGMALLVRLEGRGAPECVPALATLGGLAPRRRTRTFCPRTIRWVALLFRRRLLWGAEVRPQDTGFAAGPLGRSILVERRCSPEIYLPGARLGPDDLRQALLPLRAALGFAGIAEGRSQGNALFLWSSNGPVGRF